MRSALIAALAVGTGGFLGALARYGLGGLVHRRWPLTTFPYGTLVVNLVGCLVIGALAGFGASRQVFGPTARTFLFIGVLGGFTTFSTFCFETVAMLRDHEYLWSAVNVGVHVVLGLAFVWVGYTVTASR